MNIDILKTETAYSISNYARMGIIIEIIDYGLLSNTATVTIRQTDLINGHVLNQKQLVQRVKDIFSPLGVMTKVSPLVYKIDTESITTSYIDSKMKEFGIKRKDIVKQLGYDESSLSLYLSGKNKMNKSVKASFFWLFTVYELNRDLREQINL